MRSKRSSRSNRSKRPKRISAGINKTDESFKDFVLDQLCGLDGVEARRMFGSFGFYREETFFAIVHRGRLYFKVDAETIREYRARKMKPFRPNARQTLKSYYQVPVEILEDPDELAAWAARAMDSQRERS